MAAKLLYTDPQGKDYLITLPQGGGYLGRSAESLIYLFEHTVTIRHAAVSLEQGAWYVTDLGGANGTCVNDQPVSKAPLADGDWISCGTARLRFLA